MKQRIGNADRLGALLRLGAVRPFKVLGGKKHEKSSGNDGERQ